MKAILRFTTLCLLALALLLPLVSCTTQEQVPTYTEGLAYTSRYDGTCALSGMGDSDATEIYVPDRAPNGDRVVAVENSAFKDQSAITKITLPDGITEIGDYAFAGCSSLTAITLPYRLTHLGDYAFKGCSAADRMYIGPHIKVIGDGAFFACNGLVGVFYEGTATEWGKVFLGENNSALTVGVTWYYYSERRPTQAGHYWHYNGGSISIW